MRASVVCSLFFRIESDTVIDNVDIEIIIVLDSPDNKLTAVRTLGDAVLYCIFGQRLYGQHRNMEIRGSYIIFDLEIIIETKLLECKIILNMFQFFRKRCKFVRYKRVDVCSQIA